MSEKERILIVGNGMAGGKLAEELVARGRGRFEMTVIGLYGLIAAAAFVCASQAFRAFGYWDTDTPNDLCALFSRTFQPSATRSPPADFQARNSPGHLPETHNANTA